MDSSTSDCFARDEEPDLVNSDLNESQLRELYETAEIRRFLNIFSTFVSEVKTSDHDDPPTALQPLKRQPSPSGSIADSNPLETEGREITSGISHICNGGEESISAYIAEHHASPLLPAQRREVAPFTLTRMRLTLSRLYIVAQIYWPHIRKVWDLAQWTSFGTSFVYCTVYWILWWYNFLLPSLILLLLAGLLGRGIFPYPSVEDLREYHRRLGQAKEFSDQFSDRLSPTSTIGFKELFRLYRLAHPDSNWNRKHKRPKKRNSPSTESINFSTDDAISNEGKAERSPPPDDATVLDDPEETKAALELRRWLLHFWTEVADLNERLRK
ncbi:hypothetical protein EST38_g10350 [Candolleomyces aberdarensis]|uniref:Uncharacterized protein n=1 Tax=Candolleomyces aberdarensis TaxID=2316362 RepID=A0A4Q2D999_9AGAR|nr:hypothetical protein EST38_g10350 [Candolleomyces aberdarensis]